MNHPVCMKAGCDKPTKILSCRIKAGLKFCSLVCAAQHSLDNTMEMIWCKKHSKWEDEETDCERYIPMLQTYVEEEDDD